MHTSSHWFEHFGEDLAHRLGRQWAAFGLRVGDFAHWLMALCAAPAPSADAEIQWDDGEPEDKV